MASCTKTNKLIVLSDGKQGHLNQSLAVAELAKIPEKKIITVQYKKKWYSIFLMILIHLPFTKVYCKMLIRFFLLPDNANELLRTPCHAIVSTGSSLSSVNLALSHIHDARSIVIMHPPLGRQKKFTLRIIPQHDNPKKQKNTIVTIGAPTRMSEMNLNHYSTLLAHYLNLSKQSEQKVMSLFIGGTSSVHQITLPQIEEIITKIRRACEVTPSNLLVTTSRRTPSHVIEIVKKKFSSFPFCRLIAVPTEGGMKFPSPLNENLVFGMMGLSDIILVTEDSISMISEAASSGKKAIVIEIDKKYKLKTKYQRLIETLAYQGYISTCKTNTLDRTILDRINDPTPPKILEDSLQIKRALQQLL